MSLLAFGKDGFADAWNYSCRASMGCDGKPRIVLSALTLEICSEMKFEIGFCLLEVQLKASIESFTCFLMQVDLFFYREPEEAKEKEEEEAVAPPDYGIADYGGAPLVASDQWAGQISDAQWGAPDLIPAPDAAVVVPPVSNVEWTQEPG